MKRPAFTIVEMLVVMGIVGTIGTILALGLVQFRLNIQQQQATSDFLSYLRLAQNLARNGALSEVKPRTSGDLDAIVDGYAIFLENNNTYSMRYCTKPSATSYDCSNVEKANLKLNEFYNIQIFATNVGKCRGIVFARLTGDITAANGNVANMDDSGTCRINIRHNIATQASVIDISLVNDFIDQ